MVLDAAGNAYGTTQFGGGLGVCGGIDAAGCGTAYELNRVQGGGWALSVLHTFTDIDGAVPKAGLIFDAAGNLYGTTYWGGQYNNGTVFEITP